MKFIYKSYEDTVEFLKNCVKEYPHLIKIESIGKTHEQREIYLATVSMDVEFADLKPALLYTGTIHAREWIGNELAVAFIDYLLKNHKTDPRVISTLSKSTLYIVPILNPDGFVYSQKHYSFWRKNRRKNEDGSIGVDLNRNFSVGWVKSKNPSSNVYGGPAPFSEPETRAIKEFVDSHPNITIALDYHSQGNVFFPAHKFNHEAEIDGTDLNVFCANMNYEIKKVTNREYGIHRGKPPTKLISGSGREYYYSKGILASVVEVGTRNIPDYLHNMTESINENIPALLYALSETVNRSKNAPSMPQNFEIEQITNDSVTLKWDSFENDVYFEIYRNTKHKYACKEESLIAVTKNKSFTDKNLQSGKLYFYYIRAVDPTTKLKSPFAPQIKVRTLLNNDEFFRIIFPTPSEIGYVNEKSRVNKEHFGKNSMFVGVSESKSISYGVVKFKLNSLPKGAYIKEAKISLYPLNRVNVKKEKYGEWSISFLDKASVNDISDFSQIHNAKVIQTLSHSIKSEQLTQGIWKNWEFNEYERKLLAKELEEGEVLFRIQGPKKLPIEVDSQMMMFDIGYGPFGGGIHYRPHIEIKYTVPPIKSLFKPVTFATISEKGIQKDILSCGYDENANTVFGYMEFDISSLPDFNETILTNALFTIFNKGKLKKTKYDIRYLIEFVECDDLSYESIKNRNVINTIGYEVSEAELIKKNRHTFLFDTASLETLEEYFKNSKTVKFIIRPTLAELTKNRIITWQNEENSENVILEIEHIKKRRSNDLSVKNVKTTVENNTVKLTWENPKDDNFVGVFVVRNRFHPPKNPYDGVKLYAGKDNYTYDKFGNPDIEKYFAIFTYDDVPNYSEPVIIHYKP